MIATCSPQRLHEMIERHADCQLLDVREFPEFAAGHVPGARLVPLGRVSEVIPGLEKSRPIVLICKSGKRARHAAELLADAGCERVLAVDGGTDAWIAAGYPVAKEHRAPWALERQVRLASGTLVLIGLFIPPWPFLSALVGAGLVFAAVSNTCGMGMLLAKMPWNRPKNSHCGV